MLGKFVDKLVDACGLNNCSHLGIKSKVGADRAMDMIFNPKAKSEFLPYFAYDQTTGIFINDENAYGFVIEMAPFVNITNEQMNQVEAFLRDQMPEKSYLQLLTVASKQVDHKLDDWANSKTVSLGSIDAFWLERIKYYKEIADGNSNSSERLKVRNFRVYLSFSLESDPKNVLGLEHKIYIIKKQLLALLNILGLPHSEAGPEELLSLVDDMINIKHDIKLADNTENNQVDARKKYYDPYKSISSQLIDLSSAFVVTENGIEHNNSEYLTRLYSVDKYPDFLYQGQITNLLGDSSIDTLNLACNFFICLTIASDITEQTKKLLLSKGNAAQKNSESWVTRLDQSINKSAQEWAEISYFVEKGERLFSSNFQIMIRDRKDRIEYSEQVLRSLFSSNSWQISADKYFHMPALVGMLPMSPASGIWKQFRYFGHYKTSILREVLALMPIYGDWNGTNKKGMLLLSRRGEICNFNLFEERKNYNMIVVAPSGSGKSVFVQDAVLNLMSTGVKVFILDIGRSYEKISELAGGDFIEFNLKSEISLNPFTNIPEGPESEEFLDYVKQIICLMASPSSNLTDLDKSILEEALLEGWREYGNKCTITKIAEILKGKNERETKNLATMLGPFTANGIYGKYFERPATTDFKKLFTVFEFEEIVAKEDLLTVVMASIAIQIVQKFSGDRSELFALVLEEAWRFIGKFAPLLERFIRTFRKYGGALIIVTQGYTDFKVSREAKVLWDNSQWHIFLPHDSDGIATLRATGDIEEKLLSLLSTTRKVPGLYSEVLIASSQEMVVTRLALDPYSGVLYSTNSKTFNKIRLMQQSGISLLDAIRDCADGGSC